MIVTYLDAKIDVVCIHQVGNKIADEGIRFSQRPMELSTELNDILLKYFINSFQYDELYKCHHDSDIALNEVYHYCSKIFSDPNLIQEESINLATHLYNQSTHPKIKAGEFYVVYFSNCEVDGKCINAIGLFKSENKDTFLKIHSKGENFEIESESGININKLDKGCLIFNTERDRKSVV